MVAPQFGTEVQKTHGALRGTDVQNVCVGTIGQPAHRSFLEMVLRTILAEYVFFEQRHWTFANRFLNLVEDDGDGDRDGGEPANLQVFVSFFVSV